MRLYLSSFRNGNNPEELLKLLGDGRRTANAIIRKAGIDVKVGADTLATDAELADFDALVQHTSITATPHEDGAPAVRERFLIPRLLIIGDKKRDGVVNLGETLAHELDHWDFFLNTAARLLQELRTDPSLFQLKVISEKRATASRSRSLKI